MDPTLKVAKRYPKIMFEHATGFKRAQNMGTYSGRFYEGRYIQGVIAGKMSKKGVLGYIASFPIPEVISGINATMLGAQIGQSQHQGQDHLGEHLVRSGQGSRRRQGAGRPGRRRADAAHRLAGRHAGRRSSGTLRLRPGLRHDQVRAEGPAHLDHRQLGALLHPAQPRPCSTAPGSRKTPGTG